MSSTSVPTDAAIVGGGAGIPAAIEVAPAVGFTSTQRLTTATRSNGAAWSSAWCPVTFGSISKADVFTTNRSPAGHPRHRRLGGP